MKAQDSTTTAKLIKRFRWDKKQILFGFLFARRHNRNIVSEVQQRLLDAGYREQTIEQIINGQSLR